MSSGPIVKDKLHFRAAGSWREFDGLHDNITTGKKSDHLEEYSLRLRADYQPSENLNLDLRLSRHQTTIGGAFVPVPDGNPNIIIPVQAGINSKSKNRLTDASIKIDYETSLGTLTSVTSWSEVSLDMLQQLGQGIPNPTLGATQGRASESISEDFRLQSSTDEKLRYVVGAYYLYYKPEISTTILFLDETFQPAGKLTVAQTENSSDAYAVYGQLNYDLSEDLELTLGLRYDRQKIEQIDLLRDATRTDVSFDSLQPKVSLAYSLNPDSLVYATYSEGFRSGGFNAPSPLFPLVYDAESTENVEIGMKTSFMDGSFIFNVAGFYTRDENQPLQRLVVATQGITTIEETEFKGLDVDATVHVGEGLVLTGGIGWIDSEIKDYDGSDTYVGNRAPLSYEFSYNVAAQYSMNFGEFDLVSRVDVSRNQGLYWHVDNEHKQSSVTLVNGRMALEFEKLELAVYAKNLFNEKYYQEYCSRVFCGAPLILHGWEHFDNMA
ncbi:TonB-dependent receptor [Kineobactrum salinum]|uniref:TonB-dependent receptor n=1 Tax=Kineobactrum salinum TaxID=2708301 RepID=A0A6C0U1K1_9GAMM|nr:TonB-dependent receptor [Kineobactrum salinum]QIB65778.1 TonB-dependent receptor [Kineobactrum salinum]